MAVPIYEYQCLECQNIVERIYLNYKDVQWFEICNKCGGRARKIISAGAIHTDEPTWINNELRGSIQGDNEKPIRNRKDLAEVVAKKKIEPIEKGHRNLRMI